VKEIDPLFSASSVKQEKKKFLSDRLSYAALCSCVCIKVLSQLVGFLAHVLWNEIPRHEIELL